MCRVRQTASDPKKKVKVANEIWCNDWDVKFFQSILVTIEHLEHQMKNQCFQQEWSSSVWKVTWAIVITIAHTVEVLPTVMLVGH